MKKAFIFCIVAAALAACSKDKFKTEPEVEIKSFGPDQVNKGEIFTLRAIVRDKEGDINNTMTLVRKIQDGSQLLIDTLPPYSLDFTFPKNESTEIQIEFSYGVQLADKQYVSYEGRNRKIAFGIIVTDKAGHKSPYVETDPILLKQL